MNDDRKSPPAASDEAAGTIENAETIEAEEDLRETSTHTKIGVIPAGYGTIGGFAGEDERPDHRARDDRADRPPDNDT